MSEPESNCVDVLWNHATLPQFANTKPRYAIGISYTNGNSHLQACLVRALGRGIHLVCDVIDECIAPLNDDAAEILTGESPGKVNVDRLSRLKIDLAEFCGTMVRPLVSQAKRNYNDALVLGVQNLGIWIDDRVSGCLFESVCSSSILAEATGVTVVDDFPTRDLAHAGQGGPINVLADWILIGDRSGVPGIRNRAILRLDQTFRLNVIPNRSTQELPANYVAIDIHPGLNLINAVGRYLNVSDPLVLAPTFAVQGKIVANLLAEWRNLPTSFGPWSHLQKLDDRFQEALRKHVAPDSSNFQDVFATTLKFLGENSASQIKAAIPDSMPLSEIVLAGPLQQDGMFVSQLKQHLPNRILPLKHFLGLTELDATAAAVLALARIDQLVGNAYRSSKVKVPRCLGRITPGNPKNWEQVTIELFTQLTSKLKLKEAV